MKIAYHPYKCAQTLVTYYRSIFFVIGLVCHGIRITKWQNFDVHIHICRSTKNNSWFKGVRISYKQVLESWLTNG